jgi:CRISPR-associated exonuclease Cas4
MESAPAMVRVSDLRQWVYCPRVVWWTHVCPVGKVESFKMKLGLTKERRLQRLVKRRTLQVFNLRGAKVETNVTLSSKDLGLSGRLDLLLRHEAAVYPVEVRFTQGPARLNHKLQLAGYAMLLEECYRSPVPHGYIVRLPDDTVEKVAIDASLRRLTLRTLQAVQLTLEHERMPPPASQPARCRDCEYSRFCGDIARTSP